MNINVFHIPGVIIIAAFLFTGCNLFSHNPETPDDYATYTVSSGVVQNHFTANTVYSNSDKKWTLTINTDLQNVYRGASIKRGFEIYQSSETIMDCAYEDGKTDSIYYINSSGQRVSDNCVEVKVFDYSCHAVIYLSVIMENTIAENVFYMSTLTNLQNRIDAGETLTQGERDLYNSLKQAIEKNNLKWLRQMKGRCYIMVDGNKYYKEYFSIPAQYLK